MSPEPQRVELPELRGPAHKTYRNPDGTFTAEVGGGVAHHKVAGLWVPTDCALKEAAAEAAPTAHGHDVRIPENFATALQVGDVSLRPLDISRPPAKVSVAGSAMTYKGAWDGITVVRRIVPEGLVEELRVTSAAGQRVLQWTVTGSLEALRAPHWETPELLTSGPVPWTLEKDVLSYDLRGVPVGGTVM